MELKEFYAKVGGDYDVVLQRLPAPGMIKKFVGKFAKDPSYKELMGALQEENFENAFRAAHTIKGTAATLGLDTLANVASELTEQLRGASVLPQESYVKAVEEAYRMTMDRIGMIEI